MSEHLDEIHQDEPDGELVHWMERPPLSLGAGTLSGVVLGAFLLGALTTLGVVALSGRVGSARPVRSRIARLLH